VASGDFSFVGGGLKNVASGLASFVGGGGTDGSVSGNTASGTESGILGGGGNNASGSYSAILGGYGNTSSGSASSVLGGLFGTTRSIIGSVVSPASYTPLGTFATGNSQAALLILARQTTDATATVLASNASAASTTNQVILAVNSAYYFRGEVIAGVTAAGDTKGWYIEGAIKRATTTASTALVGTPTVTSLFADAGAATWTVAVAADTTNGGLKVTVTGAASTTIRWVAQICTTEMTY
jgi:hypothetical protein